MNKKSLKDVGKRTVEGLFFFSFLICMQITCMDRSIYDGWATLPEELVASILQYGDFCLTYNVRRVCKNYHTIIKPHGLSAQNSDIDTYTKTMICYARDDNKDMFVWLKKNTIPTNRRETNYIARYICEVRKDKEANQVAIYKNSECVKKALYKMCGYSGDVSPLIRLLLHQDIDINHQWSAGDTLLHFMAFGHSGTVEQRCNMIELLLKQPGIKINAQNASGETPLHYTIYDVRKKDGWRGSLSDEQYKKMEEHFKQMKQLLDDQRIVINMQDNEGNTVVHRAIIYGNDKQIEYLLQRTDIDINIQNNDGNASAHFYNFYKNSDNIKNFIVNTAIKNKKGNTPLHLAKKFNQYNYLLNAQDIDVNTQNKKGETPLHYSIKHPYITTEDTYPYDLLSIVTVWDQSKALLHDPRTDITIATTKGKTPLHYAAKYSYEILELLVQKLDEDALKTIDNEGRTALHVAAHYGNNKSVALLLARLSQEVINLEDNNGETPLDHAYKKYGKKRSDNMCDWYRNFADRDKKETIGIFLKSDKVDTSFFCLYKKIVQRGLLVGLVSGLAVIFIYFLYGDTRV